MITRKQIRKFAAKHHLYYEADKGDGVHMFLGDRGGFFFNEEDILIDLEKDVPVGLIELYMAEATDGHVRDFETWLVEHRYA